MSRHFLSSAFVAAAVLFMCGSAWAQGCSGCRAAMEFSEEGRVMGASLNAGILMLMSAPYALLGAFGYAIYRGYRRDRKKDQQP